MMTSETLVVVPAGTFAARKSNFTTVQSVLEQLGPINWLVDKFLERNATSVLFAPPGEGKSFFAIDFACCVATGTPWHGEQVVKGPVVYIAGEGHGGLARRFAAWAKYTGVDLRSAQLVVPRKPVIFFDEAEAKLAVEEALGMFPGSEKPVLVIIDTVARAMEGGDENQTQDMVKFMGIVDRLTREPWGCHVMLVHHTGHGGDRERGSSALGGNMDQRFQIKKSAGSRRTLICHKMKDAPEPSDRPFELTSVELGEFEDNFGRMLMVTSAVPVMVQLVKEQAPVVDKALTSESLVRFLADGWKTNAAMAAHFSVSKTTVTSAVKAAVRDGLLLKEPSGRKYKLSKGGQALLNLT